MLWIPESGGGWMGFLFRAWRNFGWMGVDLFFVLSGFLVGGLLIREQHYSGTLRPWMFLVRRGLRIYPAFYIFLFLSLFLSHVVGLTFQTWPSGFWSELFFFQNYVPGLWPQTWSLAVEEHFYILLVWALVWMCKKRASAKNSFHALPKLVLMINVSLLLGRVLMSYVAHASWSVLTFQTHWRLDSLLFGVLLAYGVDHHPDFLRQWRMTLHGWRWMGIPLLIVPSMVMNLTEDRYVSTFGATALYLGFGWVLIEVLHQRVISAPKTAPVSALFSIIGKYSYSIYLWHFTLYYIGFAYIHRKLGWHLPLAVNCVGFMVLAIIGGIVMSCAIEQPFLYWRNRWFPSPTTSLTESYVRR